MTRFAVFPAVKVTIDTKQVLMEATEEKTKTLAEALLNLSWLSVKTPYTKRELYASRFTR